MAITALDGTELPPHPFTPDPGHDPDDLDPICVAALQIGNVTTQCGHPRHDHDHDYDYVEPVTSPGGRDAI